MNASAFAARRARGITLIECVIALAILAALMSVALPSFGEAMARARLRSAAQDLALGLGNARLESVRAGAGQSARWPRSIAPTRRPAAPYTWCAATTMPASR
jgi:prepilin-type N-terminal cleavage/methylation domain-containing protein